MTCPIIVCQYHIGEINAARQACIEQLKANLPYNVKYEMIREPVKIISHRAALKPSETIRRDSCLVRLLLLQENPDRLWIDTDVKINSWPDFIEGKTYLYGGSCPAAIMYLKGAVTKIQQIIEEFAQTNLMCPHHWLYNLDHIKIPENCFNHLKLSSR